MYQFVSGALTVMSLVPAVFFWATWRRTRDRFFLLFSLAFGVLGIERLIMGIKDLPESPNVTLYLIRLVGFLLIALAIIDKNRSSAS